VYDRYNLFKDELAIVIHNHGEAVTIEAVVLVLETNEAVVFEVRTHRPVAVVFLNYKIYHRQLGRLRQTHDYSPG
jgi:hypothetical protein